MIKSHSIVAMTTFDVISLSLITSKSSHEVCLPIIVGRKRLLLFDGWGLKGRIVLNCHQSEICSILDLMLTDFPGLTSVALSHPFLYVCLHLRPNISLSNIIEGFLEPGCAMSCNLRNLSRQWHSRSIIRSWSVEESTNMSSFVVSFNEYKVSLCWA